MMGSVSGGDATSDGSMLEATRQAHRVSESTEMKTKIKDIELPEFSSSEGSSSKAINPDMEDILQKSMKQFSKRASAQAQVSDITELVLPRKRLLFLTVPPSALIKWSSKPLKNPLSDIKPQFTKDALKCFTTIQRYMEDRGKGSSVKGTAKDLQSIADRGICVVGLREELYLQLYKQLNENPSPSSVVAGWEIMSVASNCFTAPAPLSHIIEEFVTKHAFSQEDTEMHLTEMKWKSLKGAELDKVKIGLMARYTLNCMRLTAKRPKGRVPSVIEVEHFLKAPFKFNVFGETLQNIVKNPQNIDEDGKLPKVLSFLAEAVLRLGGHGCEGIFRIPGDLDGVMNLKMRIEEGEYSLEGLHDPAIPASLLKMWVRELAEPVIPNSFYGQCLRIRHVQAAMDVVDELPALNRSVIKYLAKYLQLVGDPMNQPKTKMSVSNLAIVFAPNLLRCPDDNPAVIWSNAKQEQHFVKLIVNYLDE